MSRIYGVERRALLSIRPAVLPVVVCHHFAASRSMPCAVELVMPFLAPLPHVCYSSTIDLSYPILSFPVVTRHDWLDIAVGGAIGPTTEFSNWFHGVWLQGLASLPLCHMNRSGLPKADFLLSPLPACFHYLPKRALRL